MTANGHLAVAKEIRINKTRFDLFVLLLFVRRFFCANLFNPRQKLIRVFREISS